MALKVCAVPGCPRLQPETRCAEHRRKAERARGSSTARGYDYQHQQLRADWQRRMDAGEVVICWRCAEQDKPHAVDPTSWHLGHDDHDRSVYRGPECVAGNTATAGR